MRVLIVEDEPVIAARLERQLKEILVDRLARIKCLHHLDDARDYLAEHTIDLLMLDLNLHGEDGFELLRELSAASFHTIVVSAYADSAITAFEHGVMDFIPKPFALERLRQGVDRLLDVHSRHAYGARYLSVRQAGTIKLIEVDKIDYVVANGHYSDLILGGDTRLHDKSIERLLAILPPNFERIHRSYLVNMNRVSELVVEAGGRYFVKLKSGQLLPLGRSRFADIKQKLLA